MSKRLRSLSLFEMQYTSLEEIKTKNLFEVRIYLNYFPYFRMKTRLKSMNMGLFIKAVTCSKLQVKRLKKLILSQKSTIINH